MSLPFAKRHQTGEPVRADANPSKDHPRVGLPWQGARWFHGRIRNFLGATIALAILVALLASTEPTFLTSGNLKNVLITNSSLMIVSVGMTFVMISAGFDLSIGAMMAVSEEILYELLQAGLPPIAAIAAVLVIGLLVGALLNGVLIGVLGINFFVATLGSMTLLYGLVDVVTNGASQIIQSTTLARIGNGTLWGMPMPILFVIVTVAIGGFVLRWTEFGRSIYGSGGNREAARLAGIPVPLVIMAVYGVAGLCGALAGVVEAARLASATPTAGSSIALISGAAVLLGGTSLFGGVGGLSGTVVGVAVIGVLGNGVNLLGVSNFWQDVVTGAVLLGAILLDRIQKRGQPAH
ncbi:MAG: ABC transporter permease [Actinomycetota bacterium]|nr:ABC transporter permease [Actinomycetota bacterium]